MPENSVLTVNNKTTCQVVSAYQSVAENKEKTYSVPEFVCAESGYSATCCWNQYEISSGNKLNFSILSTKQTALPPLASVFSNDLIDFCTPSQDLVEKDAQKPLNRDEIFSIHQNETHNSVTSNSEQYFSGTIFSAAQFPSLYQHTSQENNDEIQACSDQPRLPRKRPHSSTLRENPLPPNVNTAFKVSLDSSDKVHCFV